MFVCTQTCSMHRFIGLGNICIHLISLTSYCTVVGTISLYRVRKNRALQKRWLKVRGNGKAVYMALYVRQQKRRDTDVKHSLLDSGKRRGWDNLRG